MIENDLDRVLGPTINGLTLRMDFPYQRRLIDMNCIVNRAFMALFLTTTAAGVEAVGFKTLHVEDPGYADITMGLWYPSDAPVPDEPNTEFERPVAMDAQISQSNGGLIVMSHGFGGWYAGHANTAEALAEAGFIVAAPSHTGNTWSDMSSSIDQWSLDRPRHISRVIDHMLSDKGLQSHFDPEKIGIYGFSAGGYTALNLIGGVPDLNHAEQYCQRQTEEFVCTEGMIDAMRQANHHELPDSAWGHDGRIQAASISAPGLGFAYTQDSLSTVSADVQLWSGELDVRVPTQSNAAHVAAHLPVAPETHWIDKANHFAFMVVNCREAFKEADPEEYQMICGDEAGFDRYQMHDHMHVEMIRFFKDSLEIAKQH